MYIKRSNRPRRAFTLVEMMVASGLFSIAALALLSIYLYSVRAFHTLANYAELDQINRNALETVTKELRQADRVTGFTTNSVSFINVDGHSVSYYFNDTADTLVRNDTTTGDNKVLVSSCSLINFEVFQRNNISNTFDQYPAATNNWSETVKVVRMTWKARRTILGTQRVSEDIQTARVVLRNQQD